jgi:hypothetical protein
MFCNVSAEWIGAALKASAASILASRVRSAAPMRIWIFQATCSPSLRAPLRTSSKFSAAHFGATFANQIGTIRKFASDLFDDTLELGAVPCSMSCRAWFHKSFRFGDNATVSSARRFSSVCEFSHPAFQRGPTRVALSRYSFPPRLSPANCGCE